MTRWPRMMRRRTAAEYVDMTEAAFEREVLAGRLPSPVLLGGRDHWDRFALDEALNQIAGITAEPDYRKDLRGRYGQAA